MYKVLLSLLCFVLGFSAHASTCSDDYELIILLSDSTTVTCDFTHAPQMSFADNQIILEQTSGEAQRWEFDEVLSWSFGTVSGIKAEENIPSAKPSIYVNDLAIVASGASYMLLTVYDLEGNRLSAMRADAQGKVAIDLTDLPSAIYIVKFGTATLKFSKR